WIAGCGIAMVVLVGLGLAALRAPPLETAAALGLTALSPLLLGNVLLSRFDLLPTALTAAVVAALLFRRDALAAVLLAVAIAVKLYPGVLVPLGVAWVWRHRGREPAVRPRITDHRDRCRRRARGAHERRSGVRDRVGRLGVRTRSGHEGTARRRGRRGDRRVHGVQQGLFAAVHDLARPGRRARARLV